MATKAQRTTATTLKTSDQAVVMSSIAAGLAYRLYTREAHIAVLGLGYAGLPMAVELARSGFSVSGIDINRDRVDQVNRGRSPVSDVADADIAEVVHNGHMKATTDFGVLDRADGVMICVPTPLDSDLRPNFSYVRAAAETIAAHLHPGMLIVLQSTCSPGTTRNIVQSTLETADGMRVGRDFFIAFAPERIDPGNHRFNLRNTPKLVGGITPQCTELVSLMFSPIVDRVMKLSCPEVAEMAKLVENTFRFINISFANELTVLCDRLGVDVWEVIDAAATKPFAFMPHYPGPGVGGECIPVVPFFLHSAARDSGVQAGLIEAAGRINDEMPRFIVAKLERLLAERGRSVGDGQGLLLGLSYKENVGDMRESPALRVLELLTEKGGNITYHDPYVPQVSCAGTTWRSLSPQEIDERHFDYAVLLTAHRDVDYPRIAHRVHLVLDARNHFPSGNGTEVIRI